MLDCDALRIKCETREVISKLYQSRVAKKGFGSIGNIQFESKDAFLARFVEQTRHAESVFPTADEIIVIGDVHADMLSFITALRLGNVVDADYILVPCKHTRIVVQMGDVLDRRVRAGNNTTTSENEREELDLLQYMYLLDEFATASSSNTRIVSLCGNHDIYNFGGNDDAHLKQFSRIARSYTTDITNRGFDLPNGFPGRSVFFSIGPMSGAAQYMVQHRPILLQIGTWLFVHGGLDYNTLAKIDRCNKASVKLLQPNGLVKFINIVYYAVMLRNTAWLNMCAARCTDKNMGDEMRLGLLPRAWCNLIEYRGQGTEAPCNASRSIEIGGLFNLGVPWKNGDGGFCVSHTPQAQGVNSGCDPLVFRVDVGLSESFGRKSHRSAAPFQILRIRPKSNHVYSLEAATTSEKVQRLR
jgi:hypothetical protein